MMSALSSKHYIGHYRAIEEDGDQGISGNEIEMWTGGFNNSWMKMVLAAQDQWSVDCASAQDRAGQVVCGLCFSTRQSWTSGLWTVLQHKRERDKWSVDCASAQDRAGQVACGLCFSTRQSWTSGLWTTLHWERPGISLSPVSLIPASSRFPVVHSIDFFGLAQLFVAPDAVLLPAK